MGPVRIISRLSRFPIAEKSGRVKVPVSTGVLTRQYRRPTVPKMALVFYRGGPCRRNLGLLDPVSSCLEVRPLGAWVRIGSGWR